METWKFNFSRILHLAELKNLRTDLSLNIASSQYRIACKSVQMGLQYKSRRIEPTSGGLDAALTNVNCNAHSYEMQTDQLTVAGRIRALQTGAREGAD